jgi:hypothetical protein
MPSWKKLALGAAAALALLLIGRRVYLALLSDETRIRRLLGAMIEEFNDGDLGAVADGLAHDFRDLTTGLDREGLLGVLRYAVFQERDPRTRRFALRVEVVDERLDIRVDGDSARAAFGVRVLRLVDGEPAETREGEVDAELRRGEPGWQLIRARHTWQPGGRRLRWRW